MSSEGKIQVLTDNDFHKKIEKGVALVDFFAVWCGPCRMLSPILEEVAQEYIGKDVIIAKVDIDTDQKIAAEFQVTSVPTIIVFKDGKEIDRLVGLRDFEALKSAVEEALK